MLEKSLNVGDYDTFISAVFNKLFGYDILEPYLKDQDVSDILVNSKDVVFIKKFGKKLRAPIDFGSEENLAKFCYKVAAMCGGKLDQANNAETVLTDRKRNSKNSYIIKTGQCHFTVNMYQKTNYRIQL